MSIHQVIFVGTDKSIFQICGIPDKPYLHCIKITFLSDGFVSTDLSYIRIRDFYVILFIIL